MPQTAGGVKALKNFLAEYGAKRGKRIFYAKANSSKKFAKATGETSVYNRGHKK